METSTGVPPRGSWAVVSGLCFCAACLHLRPEYAPAGGDGDRILITETQIERSGAVNAWEAPKRLAPQFRYAEKRGQPTQLERCGRSSILLNDAPRVFVDGADVVDFRSL